MPIKNLEALETALGLPKGDFEKLYKDTEENELPIADFVIRKKSDDDALQTNLKNEEYTRGKTEGTQIGVKEVRKAFGIDVSKKIDPTQLPTIIEEAIVAKHKITPDAKVKELEADKITLQQKLESAEQSKTKLESTYQRKEKESGVRHALMAKAPAETIIPKEDAFMLGLSKSGLEIDFEGETPVFKKNGVIQKNDKNLNPLTIDEVAPMIFNAYVKPASGGGGGGDNGGGNNPKPGTLAEFDKKWNEAGKKIGSSEYMDALTAEQRSGKLKIK